jgi:hypothetical protein
MNSIVALPIVAAVPTIAPAMPPGAEQSADPIFAAIDAYRTADAACAAVDGDIPDDVGDQWHNAYLVVLRTVPTTPAGLVALTTWAREKADWLHDQASMMNGEDLCTLFATIDDAVRGMSGLQPWSPPATAQTIDAELIQLGARFEPLVDRYYVAQRRWSRSLAAAQAEHDQEYGDPADRNYEYPPEIVAAFSDSCERSGANEADEALSEIHQEMKQLANAINASPVNSIEGLRAKALVAFWEVAPLCAGDTELSFDDAYPFQQLFTAVAEACGLEKKIAATGYKLPELEMDEDGEDLEEDCEEA